MTNPANIQAVQAKELKNGKYEFTAILEDGPACEYADGGKEWWLNNKLVTEQEVMKSSCVGKIVEIDGKRFRLEEI